MEALFVISIGFLAYTYALYPMILVIWATLFGKRVGKRYRASPLSVVVTAHNEEKHIRARLDNLLSQDYPPEMIELVVVSDGSRDRTVELARATGDPRVRVIELPEPVGKARSINAGVAAASNNIIVFADARQRFAENALAELAAMLDDETVGAVSGELVIQRRHGSDVREGIGLYWRYEKRIRRFESKIDSVIGVTGPIYAIRKSLFEPLPHDVLLAHFLTSLRITLRGYRVVFARSARAFDWAKETAGREFTRRVRSLAGHLQVLVLERDLCDPRRNRVFFQMVSHRLARLVAPLCFFLALVSNVFVDGIFFRVTLAIQLLFYSLLLLRFTPLMGSRVGGLIRVVWTFAVLNAAAVVAWWVFLTGRRTSGVTSVSGLDVSAPAQAATASADATRSRKTVTGEIER